MLALLCTPPQHQHEILGMRQITTGVGLVPCGCFLDAQPQLKPALASQTVVSVSCKSQKGTVVSAYYASLRQCQQCQIRSSKTDFGRGDGGGG